MATEVIFRKQPQSSRHNQRTEFTKTYCDKADDAVQPIFIPKTKTFSDDIGLIRKIEVGKKSENPSARVILVVGGTGSGKSTLINAMYNHMCGVGLKDTFRFKLIGEDKGKSQAHSQTEWVTAYVIHHQLWFAVPYTLILIDTPGLGDTTGVQKDEKIKEQIRQCFTTTKAHGIDQLDAVALVEPATSLRLTPTHHYILESTLSLFGKDIDENIFMLLTFADEDSPEILSSLKKLDVKFKKHFTFNNVDLFGSKIISSQRQLSSVRDVIKEGYWEMGRDSFKDFVAELDNVQPKSLKLSAETLNERRALEFAVTKIQDNITSITNYSHQLSVEEQMLQRCDPDSTESGRETYQSAVETTDGFKKRYEKVGETFTPEELMEEISRCQNETFNNIYEASQCVARLRQIALRPTPMSTADYIEILISKENTERCPGWEERQEQLKLLKERANIHEVAVETYSVPEKYVRIYNEQKGEKVLSLYQICQNDVNSRKKVAEKVTGIPKYKSTYQVILHKNRRKYVIAVACGKKKFKLRAPDSGVSLRIPRKASGVFFSHVHTDHTLFKNVIPDDECFVGPPVEFEQLNSENSDGSKLFKIKIPHCIRQGDLWKTIKVRYGNIHISDKFQDVPHKGKGHQGDIWYVVNPTFVTIYTKHFSHFTCSSYHHKCSAAAMIFLYGNLRISSDQPVTRVKVKVFICSELYVIKDYKKDLDKKNLPYGLYSVGEQEIRVQEDDFDPENSQVTLILSAEDSKKWILSSKRRALWKAASNYFSMELVKLSSVINFEKFHNCRNASPFDSITAKMKTLERVLEFQGQFDLTIHAACYRSTNKDSGVGNTKVNYPVNINFEIKSKGYDSNPIDGNGNNDQATSLQLDDKHIFEVAKCVSDTTRLHSIGYELGLKYSEISTIQTNNSNDITQAALKILHKWNDNQSDPTSACTTLREVLKSIGLNSVVNEIFTNK